MEMDMSYTNIIVNCAKTAIKILSETETLKNRCDFTIDEIKIALDKLMNKKADFSDYTTLHATCVFCMDIGGLESYGLKYTDEDIQDALLKIEELNN